MKISKVLGTALGGTAFAAAGGLAGAALYLYDYCLSPKPYDEKTDTSTNRAVFREGRRWMNEHVRRQDVYLLSWDRIQLHGNLIVSNTPGCHRYAVCVHGYRDSAESVGVFARHYYEEYGMNVLLPDLRGHGASEGSYIGMGYDDAKDLIAWIHAIETRDPEAVVILHGLSMGAATVLTATGMELPHSVKAVISDCSYTSAMEEFTHGYEQLPKKVLPTEMALQMVRGICLARNHYDLAKASPIEAVAGSSTPTLFIHGEADRYVPAEMGKRLYEAAACRKDCLWVHGAGHAQSVAEDILGYWSKVDGFLESVSPWILHDNIKDVDPFEDWS